MEEHHYVVMIWTHTRLKQWHSNICVQTLSHIYFYFTLCLSLHEVVNSLYSLFNIELSLLELF